MKSIIAQYPPFEFLPKFRIFNFAFFYSGVNHIFATKSPLVRTFYLSALVLWSLASGASHALQLGKHRGAAVMGQPLNISVLATLDGPDDLAAGCLEAEVFYADSRVQKSRVRVSTEKSAASAQDALIRIQSTLPIDEPVVTVYLRVGCQQKVEKRFVVLADMLSEPASGTLPSGAPAANPARSAAPAVISGRDAFAGSTTAAQTREAKRAEREARQAERKAQTADAQVARRAKAASRTVASINVPPAAPSGSTAGNNKPVVSVDQAPAPERQKSRLKLEPLELLAERDPALKASAELRSAPATDPAQRAAAAALWRAIAAQPEDILNDSQKLKTLESTVTGLQLQMKQNQQDTQALREDVKKAQSERFANPLVFGLAVLLFFAALGLVWLLRRRASLANRDNAVQPWWRRSNSQQIGWADSARGAKSTGQSGATSSGAAYPSSSAGDAAQPASFLDLDLSDASGQPAHRSAAATRQEALAFKTAAGLHRGAVKRDGSRNPRDGFAHSASLSARAVKAEELFDVQQQADFFVSLGQKDQAIEVLRLHIEESEQTSALVYLDLLNLYHQTEEELEFEAFRLEFNARFNGEMPAFDAYTAAADSDGLQAYPAAMSRIVALWPSPKVVTVIEESLFRQADSQTPVFDLEAYRELLLLYAMIKDILFSQASGRNQTDAVVAPHSIPNGPIGFGANHDFQADRATNRARAFSATAVVPLAATPNGDHSGLDIDFDLTNHSGNGFKSDKVTLAGARLPVEGGGAIDMLRSGLTRFPESSADLVPDSNAVDFEIEQLSTSNKPREKKAR